MKNENFKQMRESFLFDLLITNLPKQKENDDEHQISRIEMFIWMIGITAIIAVIKYIF